MGFEISREGDSTSLCSLSQCSVILLNKPLWNLSNNKMSISSEKRGSIESMFWRGFSCTSCLISKKKFYHFCSYSIFQKANPFNEYQSNLQEAEVPEIQASALHFILEFQCCLLFQSGQMMSGALPLLLVLTSLLFLREDLLEELMCILLLRWLVGVDVANHVAC